MFGWLYHPHDYHCCRHDPCLVTAYVHVWESHHGGQPCLLQPSAGHDDDCDNDHDDYLDLIHVDDHGG